MKVIVKLLISNFPSFYDQIPGIGIKGDVVSVRPNYGRSKLLLTGLAEYASPENLEALRKVQIGKSSEQSVQHRSFFKMKNAMNKLRQAHRKSRPSPSRQN